MNSTVEQMDAVVARLLSYESPTSGTTVARLTAARVYNEHGGKYVVPATAKFPHVTVRKVNAGSDLQVVSRENFDVEILVHDRTRPRAHHCEAIADVVEQAMLSWLESSQSAGLTVGQSVRRDTLPMVTAESRLSDVVTVRLLVGCYAWSKRTTAVFV